MEKQNINLSFLEKKLILLIYQEQYRLRKQGVQFEIDELSEFIFGKKVNFDFLMDFIDEIMKKNIKVIFEDCLEIIKFFEYIHYNDQYITFFTLHNLEYLSQFIETLEKNY